MSLGTRYLSVSLTIANGEQTSNSNRTGFKSTPVAVIFPAEMTGTGITFEVTDDGTTWRDLYDTSGNLVSITKINNGHRALDPVVFASVQELRVKSSGNEGAERIIKLICRDVA